MTRFDPLVACCRHEQGTFVCSVLPSCTVGMCSVAGVRLRGEVEMQLRRLCVCVTSRRQVNGTAKCLECIRNLEQHKWLRKATINKKED